ncbi:HK97 gp10 family phage protein [Halorarum halophilum]|uniref:HK97 gp10 family phage protein n=1 Tax=Halorarum halophilum TaxID=2743090 RepID=A0A7D5GMY3_9EURY|nr:HK97 gp10 family phage protein [Halobaculum halophilum]QLG28904.1 HK97 gp10 family phage protein [Halobaculum halophilum]
MNRRDFVLTALGASGAIAAAGAAILDIGPRGSDEAGPANDSDGHGPNGTPTPTTTESPQRSPTGTETSTATDTESPPGTSTESGTATTDTTSTETRGATRTETPRGTATETPGSTGTGTGTSPTSTPGARDGIEVEGTSQSGDDTRVVVELTNTNDYAVYVEAAVTWQFEGGETDSQTRAGVIAPSGSDTRQYSTDQQGTVTEWNVTLPTVQRI